jgi:peroxiredoxin/outer membrane lipoprotein-sorting protein
MKLLPAFASLCMMVTLALVGPVMAQPAAESAPHSPAPAAVPQIDDQASQVVRALADYHADLKGLSAHVNVEIAMTRFGESQTMQQRFQFAAQQPNRFYMEVLEGQSAAKMVCTGEQLFTYIPALQRYTREEAPADFQALSDNRLVGMLTNGTGDVFTVLMRPDPYDALVSDVRKLEYTGKEKVGDQEAHRINFDVPDGPFAMWISTGEKPRILRIVPDLSKALAEQGAQGMDVSVTVVFDQWTDNPDFQDNRFTFDAPADAKLVKNLFAQPKHPMVGKAAPDFTLDNLAGESVKLSDHRGKGIVILDFWATWCGPCVRAMPVLSKVSGKYADKGVQLYAVNLREDEATIEQFLEKQELDVPVLLDRDGAIAQQYGVRGIPQTVIIDKQGKIQVIHQGFSPTLESDLTEELEALLAGEDLASQ